ncbi:peptidase [Nostocoides sp. F2B08]|uniref:peptidase n=1 Tax=Nostocoides sp. F2B08 TaxID=2653936 RepID=UPI0012636954|nr:peptidase [Tetrasphaera sp. F2B08]KAB7743314.1 peptidase [Tetrasphaera sp. F2B08]
MTTSTLRRAPVATRTTAAVALAAGLTLTGALTTNASAETLPEPGTSAAYYLQQQLEAGGSHFSLETDFGTSVDYGVTADAVLALAAAGTGQAEARQATDYLAANVVNYIGFGDPNEIYAGSVAKLVNVALVQGLDPSDFGGTDLLGTLQSLETETGRFSDDSQWGDFSNTFGQSLALIGLERAGIEPSPESVAFLGEQQCPGGGFQLYMDDSPCTDAANSDPDATALAVQALIAVGGPADSIEAGLDFLASAQGADGGVGGGAPQTAPNANSTGLAGQAFVAGGRTAEAELAGAYISGLQYGCTFPDALRGGIAYDPAAYAVQEAAGAEATPIDQDRRSTTQALLALAGTPLFEVTAEGAADTAPAPTCASEPGPTGTPTDEPTDGAAPTAAPIVTGPVVETDLPQATSIPVSALALAGLLVLAGGGAAAATARRGAHR